MKKVVLKQTEEVSIDSIMDSSIVGLQWSDGIKACIIKVDNLFCSVVPYQIGDLYFVRNSKKDYAN